MYGERERWKKMKCHASFGGRCHHFLWCQCRRSIPIPVCFTLFLCVKILLYTFFGSLFAAVELTISFRNTLILWFIDHVVTSITLLLTHARYKHYRYCSILVISECHATHRWPTESKINTHTNENYWFFLF